MEQPTNNPERILADLKKRFGDKQFLSSHETAEALCITAGTFANQRCAGTSPIPTTKINRKVVTNIYALADWIYQQGLQASSLTSPATSQPISNEVTPSPNHKPISRRGKNSWMIEFFDTAQFNFEVAKEATTLMKMMDPEFADEFYAMHERTHQP